MFAVVGSVVALLLLWYRKPLHPVAVACKPLSPKKGCQVTPLLIALADWAYRLQKKKNPSD